MGIDWKRKFASRKFWAAVIGFVSAVLIYFNVDAGTIESVTSIIMSGAVLISYILAEGFIDAKNGGSNSDDL